MSAARRRKELTVEEANARLPLVRSIVRDIMQRWRELRAARSELARFESLRVAGGLSARDRSPGALAHAEDLRAEIERLEDEIRSCVAELDEIGAELKDLDVGLIDFPARAGSRTVYLCWKAGEPEIQWWHELDAGFAGRRPIGELR